MRLHDLDCWPEPFDAVVKGAKVLELRRDDRGFMVGDYLRLWRLRDPERGSARSKTHKPVLVEVTHKVAGGRFGLEPGYCALSLMLHGSPPFIDHLPALKVAS